VERVVGEDAERFGDEPVVMARRLRVPVWVGGDRYAAGRMSEQSGAATDVVRGVHLLDDGMQHRGLARAAEVVVVTAEDLEDVLLPAGNLREGLGALRRADVLVVRAEEMEVVEPRLKGSMREGALVWTVRRRLRFPGPLFVFGAGLRPVAFCAIARPEGFAGMLLGAGCGVVETVFFEDHHAYAMEDIERVVEVAMGLKATGLVTTEKDAVKLSGAMMEVLELVGPVMVVGLEAEMVFPERVGRELEARLAKYLQGRMALELEARLR
jgi:tetraacyldisaccharide 4'-kinase